jgi:hypothetical protein
LPAALSAAEIGIVQKQAKSRDKERDCFSKSMVHLVGMINYLPGYPNGLP